MGCLRILPALCMCGLASFGQTEAPVSPPPDHELYRSFLARVVSAPAPLIGTVLGFTAQEVESLRKVAADCQEKQAAIFELRRSLTLEVRLEHLATGREPPDLAGQLLEMERIQKLVVLDSVRQFQELIGKERFAKVDAYVRSRSSAGFAELDARPRAVIPPVVVPQF